MDDNELKNPITDEDATIGEAGDALNPRARRRDDKDHGEGPAPHATQMPR